MSPFSNDGAWVFFGGTGTDELGIMAPMALRARRRFGRLMIRWLMVRILIVRRKTMIGPRIRRTCWRLLLVLSGFMQIWGRGVWVEKGGEWGKGKGGKVGI